jgi:Gas vesicle protein K
MVKGEVLLSVADIDLVYLNLGLLLSSVKSVVAAYDQEEVLSWRSFSPSDDSFDVPELATSSEDAARLIGTNSRSDQETLARTVPATSDERERYLTPKASIDSKSVEKGLARLVLTLIDLIRKLMEKQAIRRIDAGQLHAEEIERVGDTFLQLDERMEQLKKTFGLNDEDLNLDLGPLGDLL